LYIDSDYKVHTTNADGRTAIETDIFDGMPNQVAERYIYVPVGKSHTKSNGETVHGEFVQPFVTEKELDKAQREYERQLLVQYETELADMRAALSILGVSE
jgi:hypothetical protein